MSIMITEEVEKTGETDIIMIREDIEVIHAVSRAAEVDFKEIIRKGKK